MVKVKWNFPELPRQKAVYRWTAEHASLVHEGYQRQDGTQAPARPWTQIALQNADIAAIFEVEFVRASGNMLRAWIATAERLDGEFRAAIEVEVYEWDRETVRSDGSVVSSPRDIVDTSELRDSQELTFE